MPLPAIQRMPGGKMRWLGMCLIVPVLSAACVRYVPQPLMPERVADRFQARSLDDEGLRRHLETALGPRLAAWPPSFWNLETLTHAAFYFHPDLDTARARWGVARAQVVTASGGPSPGLSITPAYTVGADRAPWYTQFGFDLTFETAGKRESRTEAAAQRAEAERGGVALTAWAIYGSVRDAIAGFQFATSTFALLREEEEIRVEYVSLLDTQVSVGELARPVLDGARVELQRTQLAVAGAQATIADARRDLARRTGVPSSAIVDRPIDAALSEPLRIEPSFASDIVAVALLDRIELRQMLAEYAAAEASLRLAVAQQVPDIGLGPVFRWAVDQQRWSLGAGLNPLSRQRGPIAEATARREETAARFYARQADVAANAEAALGTYQAAIAEYDRATLLLRSVETRAADIRTLFDLRDVDAVALVGSRLEVLLARRAQLDALSRVHRTLGTLEDAVHRSLTLPGGLPRDPETAPLREP